MKVFIVLFLTMISTAMANSKLGEALSKREWDLKGVIH